MKRVVLALLACLFLAVPAWAQFVDLNTAGQSELETLPGIGPAKAAAIVEYRTCHGGFSDPNELDNVPGIGAATMSRLLPLVTVDGAVASTNADYDPSADAYAATGSDDLGLTIEPAPDTPDPVAPATQTQPVAPAANLIDINTATSAMLDALPGIGVSKAAAIVADRDQNGPFSSCADLQRVTGIGPGTAAKIEPLCTAGGSTATPTSSGTTASQQAAAPAANRIEINTASIQMLDSMPGIGPSKAAAIMADRDRNGRFASCHDLTRVTGIGTGTVAKLENVCTAR